MIAVRLVEHLPGPARRAVLRRVVSVLIDSRATLVNIVTRLSDDDRIGRLLGDLFDQIVEPIENYSGGTLSLKTRVPAWKLVTLTLSPNGNAAAVLDNSGTISSTYRSSAVGWAADRVSSLHRSASVTTRVETANLLVHNEQEGTDTERSLRRRP